MGGNCCTNAQQELDGVKKSKIQKNSAIRSITEIRSMTEDQ